MTATSISPIPLVTLKIAPAQYSWDALVRESIQNSGGTAWLKPGDTVLLKPACNSGIPHPATTHPEALSATVRYFKELGAKVLVGDQSGAEHVCLAPDRKKGASRTLLETSGIAQAAVSAGAQLVPFEERGWDGYFEEKPDFPSPWESIWMTKYIQEVDHIVNLPRLSAHQLATYTCGLKNVVGYMRDDSRQAFHSDGTAFFQRFVDANAFPTLRSKIRLTLTCVDKILLTTGPDTGRIVDFSPAKERLAFASTNTGAHDTVGFALIDWADKQNPSWWGTPVSKMLPRAILNKLASKMFWNASATSIPRYSRDASLTEDRVLSRWWNLQEQINGTPIPECVRLSITATGVAPTLISFLQKRRGCLLVEPGAA